MDVLTFEKTGVRLVSEVNLVDDRNKNEANVRMTASVVTLLILVILRARLRSLLFFLEHMSLRMTKMMTRKS